MAVVLNLVAADEVDEVEHEEEEKEKEKEEEEEQQQQELEVVDETRFIYN